MIEKQTEPCDPEQVQDGTADRKSKALACRLTPSEFRERKAMIRAHVGPCMTSREDLPNGFRYYASLSGETVRLLKEFIRMEERCCGFLTFSLSMDHRIRLDITGPDGAKAFVTQELGLWERQEQEAGT